MKFYIEKDYLDKYTVTDSFGNQLDQKFDSLQDARNVVASLKEKYVRNACAWNGHDLNDEPVVQVDDRFGTSTVCQSHQGLYVKSIANLADENPTVRGNEIK